MHLFDRARLRCFAWLIRATAWALSGWALFALLWGAGITATVFTRATVRHRVVLPACAVTVGSLTRYLAQGLGATRERNPDDTLTPELVREQLVKVISKEHKIDAVGVAGGKLAGRAQSGQAIAVSLLWSFVVL